MWTIVIVGILPIAVLALVTLWYVNDLNKADERLNESLAQRENARRSQLLLSIAPNQVVVYEANRTIDRSA